MVLQYGFAIGENLGTIAVTSAMIMQPPTIPEVITLSLTNSTRFLLVGTKPEILEWLHDHRPIKLETALFDDPGDAPHIPLPDIIIDLLPCYNLSAHTQHGQQSLLALLNPFSHPDSATEPVRLEFRAVNTKLDDEITDAYFRLVVKKGCTIGNIYMDIAEKWANVLYPSIWDEFKRVVGLPVRLHDYEDEQEKW